MALPQISGSGLASQTTGTVIIGPIKVDSGLLLGVSIVSKSSSGTITTPTSPKLQYCPEETATVWADVSSGSVTPSTTSSATAEKTIGLGTGVVCRYIRVVAAGAFAAGDATIYLHGTECS